MIMITLEALSNIIKQGLNPGIKSIPRAWQKYLTVAGAEVDEGNNKDGSDWQNNTPERRPHRGHRAFCQPRRCHTSKKDYPGNSSWKCNKTLANSPSAGFLFLSHPEDLPACVWVRAMINNWSGFDLQRRKQTWSRHANVNWGQGPDGVKCARVEHECTF